MSQCILCAQRGRQRDIESGLVCPSCAVRLVDALDDIDRLAASASCEPRQGRGSGRTVPSSRPPLNVEGIDPALTSVRLAPPPAEPVPLLVVLEGWERLTRCERDLAPYGPASMARAALWERRRAAMGASARNRATPSPEASTVALTGVVRFLRTNVPWIIAQDWVDDFASEVDSCRRALLRWDQDRGPTGTVVRCPAETIHGSCHALLRLESESIRCPQCGHEWTQTTLVRAATSDQEPPDVWVDSEAAAKAVGVSASTVRRWAAKGDVDHRRGMYRLLSVMARQRKAQAG